MSLRKLDQVFSFLTEQLTEAGKHNSEFDRGRWSGLDTAIGMLSRVDECDMTKLHAAVSEWISKSFEKQT